MRIRSTLTANLSEARKVRWTRALHRVYQQYPAAIRSKFWPDIVKAVDAGDVAQAKAIAQAHEGRHRKIRAENISARRLRTERLAAFGRLKKAQQDLQAIFASASAAIADHVQDIDPKPAAVKRARKVIHENVVVMRRQLNVWITSVIWDVIRIGILNHGAALKPVFQDNKESFAGELREAALLEAKLSFGLSAELDDSDPEVDLTSKKWKGIMDSLYTKLTAKSLGGMTPSSRIWDLTNRAELDMNRLLMTGIAGGRPSAEIARELKQYLSDEALDSTVAGPGLYKSPFRNAMRLARTETNRAYTSATAAWSRSKEWLEGLRITLSPAHDVEDDCDDVAGDIVSPDELESIIPVHPHCMCFGVPVIKDEYLTTDSSDSQGDTSDEGE